MTNLPATQGVALPAGAAPEKLSFGQMLKRAEIFSRTQLVAPELQGNPEAIVLIGARGAELGVPFALALQEIYVIKNRTFASAQLRLALIRRAGHQVRYVESSSERAVIKGRRKENRNDPDGWVTATWTIQDARDAKLTEKDVWKSFPADMLRARAAGALSRMEFSDVLLGMDLDLDTAEEAGFDVGHDLDGEVIGGTSDAADPPHENDDAGEVEEAVVVEDLGQGPENNPPDRNGTAAPDEEPPARAGRAESHPVPRPKPGERQDVADVKYRIWALLPKEKKPGFVAWLEACGIPDTIDVSEAKVAAVDAELDRLDVPRVRPPSEATPA